MVHSRPNSVSEFEGARILPAALAPDEASGATFISRYIDPRLYRHAGNGEDFLRRIAAERSVMTRKTGKGSRNVMEML